MKKGTRSLYPLSLLFAAAVLSGCVPAGAQTTSTPTIAISGRVSGASGKHSIYVALWDAAGFLIKPAQQVRIDPGTAAVFQFQVPSGEWALSAYEDMNGNGVLDMGAFGPKEPSGFWRAFHAWRKPHFSDISSHYDSDTTVEIRLH